MDRLRELEILIKVASEGSFSAAARKLDLSPSAISKLIRRMEDRLGVQLFVRNSRALRLTPEGKALYQSGRRLIEEVIDAENAVAHSGRAVRGTLRVHTTLSFAKYQVAPRLPEFLEEHPRLRIEFQLGAEPIDLLANDVDVAILSGTPKGSSLVMRRITASRWIICAAPSYLARKGVPHRPEDLAAHNCLNFTIQTHWNAWPLKARSSTIVVEPHGNAGSNQGEMLLALARAGVGIVRHAEFHVGEDLRSGRLVPVLEDFQDPSEEPIYAVFANRRNVRPCVRAFLAFLTREFSGTPPWRARE